MKCLIIDDDQSCIDRLESKLKDQYGDVKLDIFQKPPHIDELQTDYDLFFYRCVVRQRKWYRICQ